jgi:hypothetical protein
VLSEDTKGKVAVLAHPQMFTEFVSYYKNLRLLIQAKDHQPEQVDMEALAAVVILVEKHNKSIESSVSKELRAYDEEQLSP